MHVSTMKKRLRRGLLAIAAWCREHMHTPLAYEQQMLNAKLRGHYQYYGRRTNYRSLEKFVHTVRRIWRRWLERRTRGDARKEPALAALQSSACALSLVASTHYSPLVGTVNRA
jgi:hypothetical protein